MNDKVVTFIIGVLVGSVLTTSGFLIYQNSNNNNQAVNGTQMQMIERPDRETPPEMPNGETPPDMPNGETPPEKPSGTENDLKRPEPPSKKDNSSMDKSVNINN